MNKLSKIITGLITSSFIVGGLSIYLANEYRKDTKISYAAESNTTTGLYKKITSASALSSSISKITVSDNSLVIILSSVMLAGFIAGCVFLVMKKRKEQ